ncbi:hypothetical protein JCGZ_05015 [Jatropha curcas]|uniref:Uncharacterized protein n=1 Tax=Jatropha curcas TaxID=180498 RepID=A0A067KV57_JATCU|nr:hypothetical protein JCGZ_05015 [Jatropha curcas]
MKQQEGQTEMKKELALLEEFCSQEEISLVNKIKERLESHGDGYVYKDFLHGWNLYKKGHMGKHDLYCDMVSILSCNYQDFLGELLKLFLTDSNSVFTLIDDGVEA